MRYLFKCLVVIILNAIVLKAYSLPVEQFLVVPHCLLSTKIKYEELAEANSLRLIKTANLHDLQTAVKKNEPRCQGFINVTQAWQTYSKRKDHNPSDFLARYLSSSRSNDFIRGHKIQYQNQVNLLLQSVDVARMKEDLLTLTHFPDRHVNSDDGVQAVNWMRQQIEALIKKNSRQDVSVFLVPTINGAKQMSLVMKIGKQPHGPGVLMGAHIDTLDSSDEYQPGADDNASGAVTLLETARILLSQTITFKKPIYFVWYAGSEEGKLGSQSVVQYFNQNKMPVDAVLQLDKTGFAGREAGIGLVDDLTDVGLTAFTADLVINYLKYPASAVRCGYACSDHVIWYQNGTRVAYPYESMDETKNPYIHRRKDTVSKLSMDHIGDFAKLSLAFAVELAEPA